ncbi:MAG: redoxin domain-containing protein, partial [Oscillospiraceae bacterium]
MNSKKKTILAILAFIIFIALATIAYNTLSKKASPQNNIDIAQSQGGVQSNTGSSAKEKVKSPDFTVLDSDGNSVKLSDLFGKPIVLNFWASWCPPCKSEMPEFDKVYGEVGKDITFVMVDLVDGQRETKEKGQEYVTDKGFSFPVYFDTEQAGAYAYEISSIPTTLFIDKDGYIVTGVQGPIDKATL